MLDIRGLGVAYGNSRVIDHLDLSLSPGESISIVGESGAGKTTLGMAIMRLVKGSVSGQVIFNGGNLLDLSDEEMRRLRGDRISMVFQGVEDSLDPVYNVVDHVAEAVLSHRPLPRKEALERARAMLRAVGLEDEISELYPHQISGGQRQRALIAMALINDPEVLILDEPTASLDALTKADIIDLLRSASYGRITLAITHDLSLASELTEKMAVLYGGRIVELGRTEDLLRSPRHPYTRGLVRSYPGMDSTRDLQGIPGRMSRGQKGCPFHQRCTQSIDACSCESPRLREIDGRKIACHRGGIVPLLQVLDIEKSFGRRKVLSGVDLTLYEGETLAVVGESGSGKSTLAKIIMGLIEPDSGKMVFESGSASGAERCRFVQMVFQNPRESISHRLSVLEAVREPLDVQKIGTKEERLSRVMTALEQAQLPLDENFLKCYPHQLSGGEAQRVAIARSLVLRPKLLVADEPTSALDPSVQAKILKLLMNLQEEMGMAILFITHDIALARKVSDRVAVLLDGAIAEEGATSEVLASPSHPYTSMLVDSARSASGIKPGRMESHGQTSWSKADKGDSIAVNS